MQGRSQRSAATHFGVSRDMVATLLREPAEGTERRYTRRKARTAPARARIVPYIEGWLKENEGLQRWAPKQRWTAHRMWVELGRQGIVVRESTVRLTVRQLRSPQRQTAYVPLSFNPGERAEFDFGHAVVLLDGRRVEVPFLAGRLRYSGALFLECFPTERQDSFLLGQRHAFEFWGGVTTTVVYDNLKPAVLEILQGHTRTEQAAFTHFRGVYRFEAIFANTAAGWEKGSVENAVGYGRRTYLVPVPEVASLEDLNARLRQDCRDDQARTMGGRVDAIADLLAVERPALLPLPERPVEVGTYCLTEECNPRGVVASRDILPRLPHNGRIRSAAAALCQHTDAVGPHRLTQGRRSRNGVQGARPLVRRSRTGGMGRPPVPITGPLSPRAPGGSTQAPRGRKGALDSRHAGFL